MNHRRIAAAAVTAWLVSIPLGALVSFAVVWNYVTQPISAVLGVAEVFACVVASTIYGAIIGAVYRPPITR